MDAKIIKRSEKSYTIEIEIPYGKSMPESGELIQQQINKLFCNSMRTVPLSSLKEQK